MKGNYQLWKIFHIILLVHYLMRAFLHYINISHLKDNVSVILHPSYDPVVGCHWFFGRESEANPARGLHANGERNVLGFIVEGPVQLVEASFVCRVQDGLERVGPREVVSARLQSQRAHYQQHCLDQNSHCCENAN